MLTLKDIFCIFVWLETETLGQKFHCFIFFLVPSWPVIHFEVNRWLFFFIPFEELAQISQWIFGISSTVYQPLDSHHEWTLVLASLQYSDVVISWRICFLFTTGTLRKNQMDVLSFLVPSIFHHWLMMHPVLPANPFGRSILLVLIIGQMALYHPGVLGYAWLQH